MSLPRYPIGEEGGANIYSFVRNFTVGSVDSIGLRHGAGNPVDIFPLKDSPVVVPNPVSGTSIPGVDMGYGSSYRPQLADKPKQSRKGRTQTVKKCTVIVIVGHGLADKRFDAGGKLINPDDLSKSDVPANVTVDDPWAAATVVSCNAGRYVEIAGTQIPDYAMLTREIDYPSVPGEIDAAYQAGQAYADKLAGEPGCQCECPKGIDVRVDSKLGWIDLYVRMPSTVLTAIAQHDTKPCKK